MKRILVWLSGPNPSPTQYAIRLLIVAIELVLGYLLAGQTNPFFYQAF
jgi:hypothetical protein